MIVIQQYNDHFLFFGSSGLIGSLTLKELLKVELYLGNPENIQKRLNTCEHLNLSNFRFNKLIYCINRKIGYKNILLDNEQYLKADKLAPISFNKADYRFEKITSICPSVERHSNQSLINNVSDESGTLYIHNNSAGNVLKYHRSMQTYQVEYKSENSKKLLITFNFVILQIACPDSSKWCELLPDIFSGSVALRSEAEPDGTTNKLPPLDEIPTMICTLGAGSRQSKAKRHYVDYELTFKLVQSFNNCEGKRLVIVTTFNNILIRHLLPYFRTKSKLETDLQHKLKPRLGKLVVLRPGPLVGEHGRPLTKNLTIGHSTNMLKQILYYKEYCFQCKLALFKEFRRIGFRTRASELIARTMYRKPGSWMLGYCIPATKAAYVAASKATDEASDEVSDPVEIITSEQMDHIALH